MNIKDLKIGQRVQTHPATDRWMRGQRFGTVIDIGRQVVGVRFDRGPKPVARIQPRNLIIVEIPK